MCGIVGLIGDTDLRGDLSVKLKMATEALFRRGPDASGLWYENNVGLGHRRLSVQDISSAGDQPMISTNGRYVIVYNGEIYNHF